MLIVLAGLPEPKVNFKIRDEHGAVILRFDLSYPGLKIAVEYDGRQHAEDPQRRIDIERRERLDNEGWRLIVIVNAGVYREPEQTLRRVHGLLVARDCPDLPRKLSSEWRRYFPGRS